MGADRDDTRRTLEPALRQDDNVTDPDDLGRLTGYGAVDGNETGGTKPGGEGAAFDEASKPQPLIETTFGPLREGGSGHASFNSLSLAKG